MLPGLLSLAGVASGGGIVFVGGATAAKSGSSSGNSTIALNSGLTGGISSAVASGDFVIAVFAYSTLTDSSRTLSITDGSNNYTIIGSQITGPSGGGGYAVACRIAYKFVTNDTATTFGPTGNSNDAGAMAVYAFRGINTATPLDVTQTTSAGDDALPDPPSITPVTPGTFIVCVGAAAHDDGVDTFTSSDLSGFLSVGSNDTYDVTIGIGHKNDWTSGAFNPAQFGFTGTSGAADDNAAMSIAIRPVG